NAYDSLGNEWLGKPVAFVSYGAEGGVRAVEHWRAIVSNFQQPDVRAQVTFLQHAHFDDSGFNPPEQKAKDLETLFDQLVDLSRKMLR
ncbi:MAG: NADPH-dependent FMN reductase, partial [Actinomycetia bacterium]|nr:NADPH-dependent FMN reductase [Actinomycetes bacterium]